MKLPVAIKSILIFFLFSGIGCENILEKAIVDQIFTIGRESNFRINNLYTSSDSQYTFQIKEINDSRCPEGAECVWAGEVFIKGEWTFNGFKTQVELHSLLKNMDKQPDGFIIQIVDAKPYPKIGAESNDLVVTLLITKK